MTLVDDRSPRLTWSGNYSLNSDPQEYGETDTTLTSPGSTMTFTFTGSYVSVSGTVVVQDGDALAVSTYVLDGGLPQTFTAPETNVTMYGVPFYQSIDPDSGLHTLVVTNVAFETKIDLLEYTPSSEDTTTTTTTTTTNILSPSSSVLYTSTDSLTNEPTSSSTATATATNSFDIVTFSSSSSLFWSVTGPSAVSTPTTSSNILSSPSSLFPALSTDASSATTTKLSMNNFVGSHQINVRAIAGGAAGGTVLVLILLFWLHRRRKRWQTWQGDLNTLIEPYDVHSNTPSMALYSKSALGATPATIRLFTSILLSAAAAASSSANRIISAGPTDPTTSTLPSTSAPTEIVANPMEISTQDTQPLGPPHRLHEDGGFRIQWESGPSEYDIPPVYQQHSSGQL